MLLWLTQHFAGSFHFLHVFQYLTFRSIVSALTALFLSLALNPTFIKKLALHQIGQSIRADGPQSHLKKSGTPTMGGVLIIATVFITMLLWGDLSNRYLLSTLFVMLGFGAIGWVDDYRKVIKKNSDGISARTKLLWQSFFALAVAVYLFGSATSSAATQLVVPFFKGVLPHLGYGFIVLAFFVIVGSSNAVNLTDGLDGLAIMPVVLVCLALAVFAYVAGNNVFAKYLLVPYIPGAGECVVLCSAIVGAGLGFLWFNSYPAQVFMGDVGSLSLGATLGVLAVIVRQELALLIMGGVFVAETVSVILQVASFKLRGKRIFRMAPLHHHFELKGWAEPKIIVRFWIITVILVMIALATLKLR